MLAFIELTYDSRTKVKSLPQPDYNRFRETFPSFHLPEWPEGGDRPTYIYPSEEILIELGPDGAFLASLGLEFTVKRFKGAYFTDRGISRYDSSHGPDIHPHVTNLQVAIPDFALLSIREVMVEEDCCTDALQDRLNDGWRILAICPPHAQRRPDYVLGRTRSRD